MHDDVYIYIFFFLIRLYYLGCCSCFETKMSSVRGTHVIYKVPLVLNPIFDAVYPHFGLLLQKETFQRQQVS